MIPNGRRTNRIILGIRCWIGKNFEHNMSYYITQVLSRHGYSVAYLHRFWRSEDDRCILCNLVQDDALHAVFYCDAIFKWRKKLFLNEGIREIINNIVNQMLPWKEHVLKGKKNRTTWSILISYRLLKAEDQLR